MTSFYRNCKKLRLGIVNMLIRNPEEEKREKEKFKKPFKSSKAEWYDDFIRKVSTFITRPLSESPHDSM